MKDPKNGDTRIAIIHNGSPLFTGAAHLAQKHGLKVVAVAGSVTPEASACNSEGIDAFFPILRDVCTLEEAMKPETAYANLTASVEQIFRIL